MIPAMPSEVTISRRRRAERERLKMKSIEDVWLDLASALGLESYAVPTSSVIRDMRRERMIEAILDLRHPTAATLRREG
jgi:hypothetical protein